MIAGRGRALCIGIAGRLPVWRGLKNPYQREADEGKQPAYHRAASKGRVCPYTSINTNLLFFEKGGSTKEVWYYEHVYPEGYKSYSKTKPIRIEEFDAEKASWDDRKETGRAWKITAEEIEKRGYNLDIKKPNGEENESYDVEALLAKRNALNEEIQKLSHSLINELKETLA